MLHELHTFLLRQYRWQGRGSIALQESQPGVSSNASCPRFAPLRLSFRLCFFVAVLVGTSNSSLFVLFSCSCVAAEETGLRKLLIPKWLKGLREYPRPFQLSGCTSELLAAGANPQRQRWPLLASIAVMSNVLLLLQRLPIDQPQQVSKELKELISVQHHTSRLTHSNTLFRPPHISV